MVNLFMAATAPDIAMFVVSAILVLGGALGVVLSHNPVRAALSLVTSLFGIALLFLLQNAQFLFAAQIVVYCGAIVILFLFVIMLLGVDRSEQLSRDRIRGLKPIAYVAGLVIAGVIVAIARIWWKALGASSQSGPVDGPGSNIAKLADSVFTQYLYPFEATALLLVIAVVGAVVLVRSSDREAPELEPVETEEVSAQTEEVES